MKTTPFIKSQAFKNFLAAAFIIVAIVCLANKGYHFGQWLRNL